MVVVIVGDLLPSFLLLFCHCFSLLLPQQLLLLIIVTHFLFTTFTFQRTLALPLETLSSCLIVAYTQTTLFCLLLISNVPSSGTSSGYAISLLHFFKILEEHTQAAQLRNFLIFTKLLLKNEKKQLALA